MFHGDPKKSSAFEKTTHGVSACALTVPRTVAVQNSPRLQYMKPPATAKMPPKPNAAYRAARLNPFWKNSAAIAASRPTIMTCFVDHARTNQGIAA